MTHSGAIVLLASLTLAACNRTDSGSTPEDEAFAPRELTAERAGETPGMRGPESAQYDEELDVFYVTNVDGDATARDGRAFIAVVRADSLGVMRVLVDGATTGVTLHAPKGLAILDDTLWVADIDVVRGFHRRTGAPIGSIDLTSHGVVFLNDIAVGPNGALYVTESGIRFAPDGAMERSGTGRIFRISNRVATEVARGDGLRLPNGITWQDTTGTWLVAPLDGRDVLTWTEEGTAPRVLASGPGSYDGILALRDGRALVSSWADSAVLLIAEGRMTRLIPGVSAPADIGYDTMRGVVAVPRSLDGKVEYFQLRAVN